MSIPADHIKFSDDGREEFLIVACRVCEQVWSMDYMPDGCVCDDWEGSLDLQIITHVRAVNYQGAVLRARSQLLKGELR